MHIFISSDVLNEIEIISNINCPLSKRFFAKSVESIRYTSIRWTDYPVLISCKTETFDNFIRILKSIFLYLYLYLLYLYRANRCKIITAMNNDQTFLPLSLNNNNTSCQEKPRYSTSKKRKKKEKTMILCIIHRCNQKPTLMIKKKKEEKRNSFIVDRMDRK